MPYISEKIKIEKTQFDRRRKLTEEDKEEIRRIMRQVFVEQDHWLENLV